MTPPSSGEKPPGLRRAPTDPAIVDQVPEPEVLARPRFERPLARRDTMPELAAVRLPPAQDVPLERAPTVLAPRPDADTLPARAEASEAADERQVAETGDASQGPSSAAAGQAAALLEERARLQARIAELERDARAAAEAKADTYPPAITPSVAPAPPAPPTKPPESSGGDGSTKALRSALTKLVLGLAALLALLGIPLTAYIQALTTQIERSSSQATQARTEAADAKAGNSKAKQEAAASKAELAAFKAYFREVMRLQGVEIAKQPGEPDAGDLKPVTPLCQPGKVCAGRPQLIITVPP